jgi:hypothetical protein
MSTRCQIGIYEEKDSELKDNEVLLYKHYDGYMEGTLPLLKEFVNDFLKSRGFWDTEYLGARLIQFLCNNADEAHKSMEFTSSSFDFTGYGICKHLHGDIEYYYALYPDRIEVYEVDFDFKDYKDFKKIKTVKYK